MDGKWWMAIAVVATACDEKSPEGPTPLAATKSGLEKGPHATTIKFGSIQSQFALYYSVKSRGVHDRAATIQKHVNRYQGDFFESEEGS